MVDIDYFRSFNEVYSHQFGDLILKQFSQTLRKVVRSYDVVTRLGGEEFVIISPRTDRITASLLAQRLLDAVALNDYGTESIRVTLKISLAVVSYPEDRITKSSDLLEAVERVLDKAKDKWLVIYRVIHYDTSYEVSAPIGNGRDTYHNTNIHVEILREPKSYKDYLKQFGL